MAECSVEELDTVDNCPGCQCVSTTGQCEYEEDPSQFCSQIMINTGPFISRAGCDSTINVTPCFGNGRRNSVCGQNRFPCDGYTGIYIVNHGGTACIGTSYEGTFNVDGVDRFQGAGHYIMFDFCSKAEVPGAPNNRFLNSPFGNFLLDGYPTMIVRVEKPLSHFNGPCVNFACTGNHFCGRFDIDVHPFYAQWSPGQRFRRIETHEYAASDMQPTTPYPGRTIKLYNQYSYQTITPEAIGDIQGITLPWCGCPNYTCNFPSLTPFGPACEAPGEITVTYLE